MDDIISNYVNNKNTHLERERERDRNIKKLADI